MTFTQEMQCAIIKCNYQKQMLSDDLGITRGTFCSRQKKDDWTISEKLLICYILDMPIPEEIQKLKVKK